MVRLRQSAGGAIGKSVSYCGPWAARIFLFWMPLRHVEFQRKLCNRVSEHPLLDALNRELAAASPELVGSGDLLRGILSGCGDCIKVLDLDGRLQFMSDGGKRVMEVDNFAALRGCPWPDFWSGE